MRIFLTCTLLTFFSITVPAQQIEGLLMAEKALASGDTTHAVILFKEVLKKYPDSYAAALRLTEVSFQQQLFSEAIQYSHITEDVLLRKIDSVTAIQPGTRDTSIVKRYDQDLASLYHFKGKIRLKQHRAAEALEELERALQYGGDSSSIFLDKGLVYLE
ncbi:MAG: tetratricopeptide repeat protein, partial [Cyclobacteriaceae bacterium]